MTVVYSSKFHSLTKDREKNMATILGWNSLLFRRPLVKLESYRISPKIYSTNIALGGQPAGHCCRSQVHTVVGDSAR